VRHLGKTAQATTEYLLMLLAAVSFFLMLYQRILSPVLGKFATELSQKVQDQVFSGDFHHLNIGR
jgi:hypothetical protein